MHIAIDSGDDDRAFGDALDFFKIIFEMRDSLLHDFGRLQNKGQDQLARAEFIAHFLHRRQEDVI